MESHGFLCAKLANDFWARRPSEKTGINVSRDINVVALVKGEERYIFLFNDAQKSETLRTLGRYASDAKLSFSWYDAAVLSQKVRSIEKSASAPAATRSRFEYPEVEDQFSGNDLFSGDDTL